MNFPASTNATTVRKVFGQLVQKELEIPCFINDYNQMNSIDLAHKFREAYDTQRIAYQTWIPLLYWVLGTPRQTSKQLNQAEF